MSKLHLRSMFNFVVDSSKRSMFAEQSMLGKQMFIEQSIFVGKSMVAKQSILPSIQQINVFV